MKLTSVNVSEMKNKFKILLFASLIGACVFLIKNRLSQPDDQLDIAPSQRGQKTSHEVESSHQGGDVRTTPQKVIKRNNDKIELRVQNLEIPLLFGESVSDEMQKLILADLEIFYSDAEYILHDWEKTMPSLVKDREFYGETYLVKKRLGFKNTYPAKIVKKNFGHLTEINGQDSMLIPEKIVMAYEEAKSITDSYSAEYAELNSFLKTITEANTENPLLLHPKDFVYLENTPILQELEQNPALIPKYQQLYSEVALRPASILSFGVDKDSEGETILRASTYAFKEDGITLGAEVFLRYTSGLWKIVSL